MGLKLTVVPEGTPEAESVMALLKPPLMVLVIVEVPWFPWATLNEAGDADRVKLADAVTVSVTVVLCWIPPPFPVTVIGYVPGGVLLPTLTVIPEVPAPGAGIGFGLKLTVVPVGTPDVDNAMELLKPPVTVVVIAEAPCLPCPILSEAGDAEMVKLGCCWTVTVSATVVFCWMPPPLPLTVMGYVPVGVLVPTVMVIVELPEPGAGIGLGVKLTVVPEGMPEADSVIALLKPPLMVVVTVDVPWLP